MPETISKPNAAELVRLLLALERDETMPMAERAQRDRLLRLELGADVTDIERVRTWLGRVDPGGERARLYTDGALSGATTLVVVISLFAGMATATGVLYYDGSGRVNVLAVLGLLLVLPITLMIVSWLAALSKSAPVFGNSLHWLSKASPGRWVPTLGRLLSTEKRRALDVLLGLRMHDEAGIAHLRRWLFLRWSHAGGVAFFVGVLVVFMALVFFTDLAFGWSTTLMLSSATFQQLVTALSAPWSWFLGDALPSPEVIEATRYYRSEGAVATPSDPSLLGRWWSFLVLAIVIYGLLPRIVSLLVAGALLRHSITRTYLTHPQSRTLLDRLSPPDVESQGEESTVPQRLEETEETEIVWPPCRPGGFVVNWSDVPVEDGVLRRVTGGRTVFCAGGGRSLAEDRSLLATLVAEGPAVIVVVTKGWEPPLLDLQDFLDALGREEPSAVDLMPIAIEAGMPVRPGARDRVVWQRAFLTSDHRLVSPPESAQ